MKNYKKILVEEKREIPMAILLGGLITTARLLDHFTTTQQLVNIGRRSVASIPKTRQPQETQLRKIELWANRISSIIPGSHCLHRATAAHVLLGLQGLNSKIIIGFRTRKNVEAHAWLEVQDGHKIHLIFSTENEGFKSKWILE